jgi:hypothetical protein
MKDRRTPTMFGSGVRIAAIAAICGPALTLVSGAAGAQEPARGETVTSRSRPELDPLGIRSGGMFFYPQLSIAELYDSNIFSTDTLKVDDYITQISPGLQLRSDWNNHALNLFAASDIGYYADNDSENYVDYTLGGDGRIDATRDTSLDWAISHVQRHEDRGSVDDGGGAEPNEFTVLTPEISLSQSFGRFSLKVGGGLQRFDFDDSSTTNHDDRDRDEWEGTLRLGYEIVPGYEAFIRGAYFARAYEQTVDDGAPERRSSTGYETVVGTALDFTGVTTGEIFAGFRAQNPDEPTFGDISGAQYGGNITWNPSGLTTVTGFVERTIEETTLDGSPGYFATHSGLSVDHELLRNLLLGVNLDYTVRAYEEIGRDDKDLEAGLYGKYMMNRNLYISANYDYTRRNSNVGGEDFLKNVFMLKLETQY